MTLRDLKIGESAYVDSVGGEGALRQHFLDMGIIPGAKIKIVKFAPMGDPVEVRIHGYELTLRLEDAGKISINKTFEKDNEEFHDAEIRIIYPHSVLRTEMCLLRLFVCTGK